MSIGSSRSTSFTFCKYKFWQLILVDIARYTETDIRSKNVQNVERVPYHTLERKSGLRIECGNQECESWLCRAFRTRVSFVPDPLEEFQSWARIV